MKKLLFLALAILITGCSNEIDRSQAEQLLNEEIGYPYIEFDEAKWNIWYFRDKGVHTVDNPKGSGIVYIKDLVENDLISMTNSSRTVGFLYQKKQKNTFKYTLTRKGRDVLWNPSNLKTSFNYWLADLPMYEVELGEITGIKFEDDKKTKAIIEYTEKITKTSPFLPIARKANREEITTRTANAELYDDGWRITSNGLSSNIKTKSKKDVKGWDELFEKGTSKKSENGNTNFDISSLLTNETTRYDCYIRKVYNKEGHQLIEVDFIQLKAVNEDGYESYKVVNTNPKLRTFLINENSRIQPNLKFSDLSKYETKNDEGQLFIIETDSGVVSSLTRNDAG